MGCGCGGAARKSASERLAARREAKKAQAGARVGGVTDEETFWNGPPKKTK